MNFDIEKKNNIKMLRKRNIMSVAWVHQHDDDGFDDVVISRKMSKNNSQNYWMAYTMPRARASMCTALFHSQNKINSKAKAKKNPFQLFFSFDDIDMKMIDQVTFFVRFESLFFFPLWLWSLRHRQHLHENPSRSQESCCARNTIKSHFL